MLQYPVVSQPEDNQSAVMITWDELRDVRMDVNVAMVDLRNQDVVVTTSVG